MKIIGFVVAVLLVCNSQALFILPVPLSVNDMREMWSGFLSGSGVLGDGDLASVSDSCLADNVSEHLQQFASQFSSFGAQTKLHQLFSTLSILASAFEAFVDDCHFSELNSHFTFHSYKYNLMEFLLHFAEEGENIQNIWNETAIHGGMRRYREFGEGVGQIVALLINTRSAPHSH